MHLPFLGIHARRPIGLLDVILNTQPCWPVALHREPAKFFGAESPGTEQQVRPGPTHSSNQFLRPGRLEWPAA